MYTAATRALWLVLAGGLLGWALFVGARVSDVWIEAGRTPDEIWGPHAEVTVRPSTYLLFAAIAVVSVGALVGRRLAISAELTLAPRSPGIPLAQSVRRFASTVAIVGLACAACAAVFVFIEHFWSTPANDSFGERLLNSYLPIVLYTVLVVGVILSGFVFTPRLRARMSPRTGPNRVVTAAEQTGPAGADTGADHERVAQRATALAYTFPLIATMTALIFGLIVYDATRTALEAWIWVLVQVVVAAGIIIGTVYAARAEATQRAALQRPAGASLGAKNLNLVLSMVFAVVVALMSLGYGSSAVEQLRVQSSISVSSYEETADLWGSEPDGENGTGTGMNIMLSAYGYDLARGSEGVLLLRADGARPTAQDRNAVEGSVTLKGDAAVHHEPAVAGDSTFEDAHPFDAAGTVLAAEPVGRDGSLWIKTVFPAETSPGKYVVEIRGETPDGRDIATSFAAMVQEDGSVDLIDGGYADASDEHSRVMAPNAGWAVGDLAPAFVLLLLVIVTLYITLNARNRESASASA